MKCASRAPWVRNYGNLSMREILIVTLVYVHSSVQTLGEAGSPKATRLGEESCVLKAPEAPRFRRSQVPAPQPFELDGKGANN